MNVTSAEFTTAAVVIGLLAGVGQAVRGWRRGGVERESVVVASAKDIVVLQRDYIIDVERRLDAAERQIAEMQTLEAQVAEMRVELSAVKAKNQKLERDNTQLRRENTALKDRVMHLEEANGQ